MTAFLCTQMLLWLVIGASFARSMWSSQRVMDAPTERELGATTADLIGLTVAFEAVPATVIAWSACVLIGNCPFNFAFFFVITCGNAAVAGVVAICKPMGPKWRPNAAELAVAAVALGNFLWTISLTPLVKV
jgi:hypothetical protein